MKITNENEYLHLEEKIDRAIAMKAQGYPYSEIGLELDCSSTQAYNYVTDGKQMLERNRPKGQAEDTKKWKETADKLLKLYYQVDEKSFRWMLDIWIKELGPKFKHYTIRYFEEKGITI